LPRIVVAHDTTQFEFNGQTKREGLGRLIRPGAQDFFGHFSLAMSADSERRPVGFLRLRLSRLALAGSLPRSHFERRVVEPGGARCDRENLTRRDDEFVEDASAIALTQSSLG
jgi:hypothetical protein